MYVYLCINILWVAEDKFSVLSLDPSPELVWPYLSSWDLLPWDFKLPQKMRILFFSSTPSTECLFLQHNNSARRSTTGGNRGKGNVRPASNTSSLWYRSTESTKGASFQPFQEEKKQDWAWLLIVNYCGYHEITAVWFLVLSSFNMVCFWKSIQ